MNDLSSPHSGRFTGRGDALIGLAVFFASLAGLLYLFLEGGLVEDLMAPSVFPGLVLACIAVLGLLLFLMALLQTEYQSVIQPVSRNVWLPAAIMALYTWLFGTIGFIAASAITMVLLMLIMGERNVKIIAATAVITPVLLKYASEAGLNIILP